MCSRSTPRVWSRSRSAARGAANPEWAGPAPTEEHALQVATGLLGEPKTWLKEVGIEVIPSQWPDYFPDAPGARVDRSNIAPTFDGRLLGDKFTL